MGIRKPPTDPLIVNKLIDEKEEAAKQIAIEYRELIVNKELPEDERDRQLDELAEKHKTLRRDAETLRESISGNIRKPKP